MIFARTKSVIFLAIHIVLFSFVYGCGQQDGNILSPQKRHRPIIIKPSPMKNSTHLTNFHKKMIAALECEDFTTFGELLSNYLMLLPYDLVIKEEAFFLSLFYLIFELISGTKPEYSGFYKTLTCFIRTKRASIYALKFSFSDSKKNPSPMLLDTYDTVPVIHIICDIPSPHDIKIFGTKEEKSRHSVFVEEEEIATLFYNQNNFARNILSLLEDYAFDQAELERNLLYLYNTIPEKFLIKKEKYFQALFVLMMTFVRSGTSQHEIVSSIGRSDVMISSEEMINVIEFKHRKSVENALEQIKRKRYCSIYHLQKKTIRMIGINISYASGRSGHVCVSTAAEPYNNPPTKLFQWIGKNPLNRDPLARNIFPPPIIESFD